VIDNTLADPEIQMLAGVYGYTAAKMQAGTDLRAAAVNTINAQVVATDKQHQATAQVQAAEKTARANYRELAAIVRIVFGKRSGRSIARNLLRPEPSRRDKFLTAAKNLLNSAIYDSTVAAVLAEYGYPSARLEAERGALNALEEALRMQRLAKIEAEIAADKRQKALLDLEDWLAQYRVIAKIALRHKPELFDKLGFTTRAPEVAAQPGAAEEVEQEG